jgi:hypothetical protein
MLQEAELGGRKIHLDWRQELDDNQAALHMKKG